MLRRIAVVVMLLVAHSGCLFHQRTGLQFSIVNDTDDPHAIEILIEAIDEREEIHNETHEVQAASSGQQHTVELGELVDEAGTYNVSATLEDGAQTLEQIEYSDETGPDEVHFVIGEEGLRIDVLIV